MKEILYVIIAPCRHVLTTCTAVESPSSTGEILYVHVHSVQYEFKGQRSIIGLYGLKTVVECVVSHNSTVISIIINTCTCMYCMQYACTCISDPETEVLPLSCAPLRIRESFVILITSLDLSQSNPIELCVVLKIILCVTIVTSSPPSLKRTTDIMISGKTVCICGYGEVCCVLMIGISDVLTFSSFNDLCRL